MVNVEPLRSMGIDIGEKLKYSYTFEFLDLTSKDAKTYFINVKADNLYQALRSSVQYTSKKIYPTTCEVVVISEEVAKEGVNNHIDVFLRDFEFRIAIYFFVTKGKKASEVLNTDSVSTGIIGRDIIDMIKNSRLYASLSNDITLFKLYDIYKSDGITPVIPVLGAEEQDEKQIINLLGVGVFKDDKLVEYIDGDVDVLKFLILTNQLHNVPYTFNYDNDKSITIEITKLSNNLIVSGNENSLKITYDIKISSVLTDLNEELKKYSFTRKDIEVLLEKDIKNKLLIYLNELIENKATDTIGLGFKIYRDKYMLWKKIQGNHNEVFIASDIDVNVEVVLNSTGMLIL